ncbi:unnamed protein product [Sphenostylis stenocarpa]|uniref:Uncharacterized protein n=1 Tax=Sphenostylis stenocarpa TaxID=92480 RepID=A0AA86SFD1_9FABA|nr:unnamed protein product [Sphenostylis stenocarpa]
MTTFVRSTALSRSRRYRYEALGAVPTTGRDHILKSVSYRRRRAKQRKVFLSTYQLDSFSEPKSPKLNKIALKLKKFVASVLKLVQNTAGSFRSKSSLSTDL